MAIIYNLFLVLHFLKGEYFCEKATTRIHRVLMLKDISKNVTVSKHKFSGLPKEDYVLLKGFS